ncbi:MAG: outer membrane beta-barrel protein [Pseudomonadota bacterium]
MRTSTKLILATLLSCAGLAAAGSALAADTYYAGASIGARSSYNLDCQTGMACDRMGHGSGKIYAGDELGAVPGLDDAVTGALEVMAYTAGDGKAAFHTATGIAQGSGKMRGVGVDYRAACKVSEDFSLTSRIGAGYTKGTVSYANGGGTDSKNALGLMYGLGVSYALNKNVSLHADWDHLPVKFSASQSAKVNLFSVGATYSF